VRKVPQKAQAPREEGGEGEMRRRPETLPPEMGSIKDYERVLEEALIKHADELREYYRLPDPNGNERYWRVPFYRDVPSAVPAESVSLHYIEFHIEKFSISDKRFKLWVRP
jgi:hypothetical protein